MQPWIRAVLQRRRLERGWTLREMDLQGAGVTESMLSRYESGRSIISDRAVEAYARLLGVHPTELWGEALEMWRKDLDGKTVSVKRDIAGQVRKFRAS